MHNRIIMDINNFNIINNKLLLFVYNCFTYEYYYDNKIFDSSLLKDKLLVLTENNNHNESRLLLTKELMLNDLYNFYCDCIVILDETEQSEEVRQEWFKKRYIADKVLWTIAPAYYNCF